MKEEGEWEREQPEKEMSSNYDLLAKQLEKLASEHKKNITHIRNKSYDVMDKLLDYIELLEK